MLNVTDRAAEKITDFIIDTRNPDSRVRIYVEGGGCAGFSYGFRIDDVFEEDDFKIDIGTAKLVVDSASAQYLAGSTIDYKEDLWESRFIVDNPNAEISCGCGSSFGLRNTSYVL